MDEWVSSQYNVTDVFDGGSGGGGVDYKCREKLGSEKIVVVKCIRFPDGHVPSTELREISVLRHLNHPNVVRFLEAMSCEDGVCLVLEYLEMDLHEYMCDQLTFSDSSDRPHIIKMIA